MTMLDLLGLSAFLCHKRDSSVLFVLSWSVWRSLWGTSMDDDCSLCLRASTLNLEVAVAQVGASDGQRLSQKNG